MGKTHRVIIVGGGPVGLALALDLGLRGVSCVVLERRMSPAPIPKGQNLTQRTMEHFHVWGLADELRAARAMPPDYPIGEITVYGSLMGDYWQAPAGREVVRPYYFQANERLPQYRMEEVIRRRLSGLAEVDLRFGWAAVDLAQNETSARAIAENATGARQVFEADYIVGCDGGHSTVRQHLGIARSGTDFDQVMMLAVFRSPALHERLKRFPARSVYRVMHPDLKGYWQFFGRIDVGEGWFFHAPLPPGVTKENCDFHALIESAAGFKFAAAYDHTGFWDLRVAVAERYRSGRIFIAGDAAHSHPPYGGFGLNNGLEDAVNLSWKLAAVLQGWGGAGLLASYDEERRPIFRDIAENFIARRIENDADFLSRYSPERDRAEFERAWNARDSELGKRARVYEPHYDGSPVVAGPPGGVTGAHGAHAFEAKPGHHLAPLKLSTGCNVFERLGRGFTLLAFDADDGDVSAFGRAARTRHIPLTIVRDSFSGGREDYKSRLILVRPDQYVVWTGDRRTAEAVFDRVTGCTP